MIDTSHLTRHVGKLANTDQRVVVAFMQIRERPDHALVIPVDNLHARFEQAVMDVLHTAEGQQAGPFALVLGRHRMPDTGETIMEALHRQGKLMAVPVQNILMLPAPNMPMKLSTILEQQGLLQQQVHTNYETEKFNPHLNNQRAETSENARAVARTLIMDAEDLEAIARSKRAQAYAKDPSLRPQEAASMAPPVQAPQDRTNPWTSVHTPPTPNTVAEEYFIPTTQPTVQEAAPANLFEDRLDKLEAMLTRLLDPTDAKEPEKAVKKQRPAAKEKLTEAASPVEE